MLCGAAFIYPMAQPLTAEVSWAVGFHCLYFPVENQHIYDPFCWNKNKQLLETVLETNQKRIFEESGSGPWYLLTNG